MSHPFIFHSVPLPSPSVPMANERVHCVSIGESRGHGQLFSAHAVRGESKSERMSIVIALSGSTKIVLGWGGAALCMPASAVCPCLRHIWPSSSFILARKGKREKALGACLSSMPFVRKSVTVSLGFYSLS